jgi:drug/metabolite transporter (DMT)-like permease
MKKYYGIMLFAAALAAVNVPFSKYLLPQIPPLLLAALTYCGGTLGLGLVFGVSRFLRRNNGPLLRGKDFLLILAINVCDSCANTMLFYGISMLNGETASLLQSFEIVATALIAFAFFKEKVSWRLWLAIAIVLGASVLLSFNPNEAFAFNPGAFLILGTTVLWGVANNVAKKLSARDPIEYSFFKCLGPSIILLAIALTLGNFSSNALAISLGLLDGFLAYGVSIVLMMVCFRHLPVSLGTALYATNPFLGAVFSLIFFPEIPLWNFYVAIVLVAFGEFLAGYDGIRNEKAERKAALARGPEKSPSEEGHPLS